MNLTSFKTEVFYMSKRSYPTKTRKSSVFTKLHRRNGNFKLLRSPVIDSASLCTGSLAGQLRQPFSYSVHSPHRLFSNSSTGEEYYQSCGSGSGIRCLFDPWIRDGKKSRSGSGIWIRDEHPGSYFRELRNNVLG
jgi:hypothetical protein